MKTKDKTEEEKSIIKFGTFELQTKSFWLSVIGILSLFISVMMFMNAMFWFKINKEINETNKLLIKIIDDHVKSSK